MSSTLDFINSINTGDEEAAMDAFSSIMSSKVISKLDAKRIEVASSLYNNNAGVESEDLQTDDSEPLGSE
jgi:hypothetical protein